MKKLFLIGAVFAMSVISALAGDLKVQLAVSCQSTRLETDINSAFMKALQTVPDVDISSVGGQFVIGISALPTYGGGACYAIVVLDETGSQYLFSTLSTFYTLKNLDEIAVHDVTSINRKVFQSARKVSQEKLSQWLSRCH